MPRLRSFKTRNANVAELRPLLIAALPFRLNKTIGRCMIWALPCNEVYRSKITVVILKSISDTTSAILREVEIFVLSNSVLHFAWSLWRHKRLQPIVPTTLKPMHHGHRRIQITKKQFYLRRKILVLWLFSFCGEIWDGFGGDLANVWHPLPSVEQTKSVYLAVASWSPGRRGTAAGSLGEEEETRRRKGWRTEEVFLTGGDELNFHRGEILHLLEAHSDVMRK